MRILVVTVQVPFARGGAEIHAQSLLTELRAAGHQAEIVAIPYKWYPPERIVDQILACRLLDLTECTGVPVDRVVGLKFPAYLVRHPNKVLWVLHQHRTAYELWGHPTSGDLHNFPNGREVRDVIRMADRQFIPEARRVFANSRTVSARMKQYCAIDSTPLYHPPRNAERFRCAAAEDFLFFPSRLNLMKRQALVVEALAKTRLPVRVRFAGTPDTRNIFDELRESAARLNVSARIEWLGQVTDDEMLDLYARCRAVVYCPLDEDYGYVTLEGMLSSKPVIVCRDSGGCLEFIDAGRNGMVCEPTPESIAAAMDEIWDSPDRAARMGLEARATYESRGIAWPRVIEALTA